MKKDAGYGKSLAGIQEIVNIRASLNLGLSGLLKEAFPNTEGLRPPPKP